MAAERERNYQNSQFVKTCSRLKMQYFRFRFLDKLCFEPTTQSISILVERNLAPYGEHRIHGPEKRTTDIYILHVYSYLFPEHTTETKRKNSTTTA